MPPDERSALPTVPGVPWWGALACAVAAVLVGYILDALRGDELTRVFSVLYFLGCVAAVLIARNRSLFTAVVQPPLVLSAAVPLAYWTFSGGPSQGLRSLMFDMALPVVERFPAMVATTLIVWVIGAVRFVLYLRARRAGPGPRGRSQRQRRRPTAGAAAPAGAAQAAAPRGPTPRQPDRGAAPRPRGGRVGPAKEHPPRREARGTASPGRPDPRRRPSVDPPARPRPYTEVRYRGQ